LKTLTQGILSLLGRLMIATIFVTSAYSKIFSWESNVQYMNGFHLPMVRALLALALVIELCASLFLIAGFQARIAAFVMFLYLIPVTLILQTFMGTQFQKNVGIMGGLLIVAAFGPGTFSLTKTNH
jgi:putative oxidoreductase